MTKAEEARWLFEQAVPHRCTGMPEMINVFEFIPTIYHSGIEDETNTVDLAGYIQSAVNSLSRNADTVTGGKIFFPRGRYLVGETISVTTAHSAQLASITLIGDGMHNTVIEALDDFSGDAIIAFEHGSYCGISDLHLLGSASLTPDNGVTFLSASEIKLDRTVVQRVGRSGFLLNDVFMAALTNCRAKSCETGFDFVGPHTSLFLQTCYALDNRGHGFRTQRAIYSSFAACGSDNNKFGYLASHVNALSYVDCGAEACQWAAWAFTETTDYSPGYVPVPGTQARILDCFSTACDEDGTFGSIYTSNDVSHPSTLSVVVDGFKEHSVSGVLSVVSAGAQAGHALNIRNSKFTQAVTGIATTYRPTESFRRDAVSVTAADTAVLELSSVFGNVEQYSGLLNIVAGNGPYANGVSTNIASYVLLVTKGAGATDVCQVASNGLTHGVSPNHPSFEWTLDGPTNQLRASPVASTSGVFYFYVTQLGGVRLGA